MACPRLPPPPAPHCRCRRRLFFFAGSVRENDLTYSGGTRQALHKLALEWNDPEFGVVEGYVGGSYGERLQQSKFCLAPYGCAAGGKGKCA